MSRRRSGLPGTGGITPVKILIDEDLDVRLRHLFPHYEAYTVEYMGWKGLPNGELLDKADGARFALFRAEDESAVSG